MPGLSASPPLSPPHCLAPWLRGGRQISWAPAALKRTTGRPALCRCASLPAALAANTTAWAPHHTEALQQHQPRTQTISRQPRPQISSAASPPTGRAASQSPGPSGLSCHRALLPGCALHALHPAAGRLSPVNDSVTPPRPPLPPPLPPCSPRSPCSPGPPRPFGLCFPLRRRS